MRCNVRQYLPIPEEVDDSLLSSSMKFLADFWHSGQLDKLK